MMTCYVKYDRVHFVKADVRSFDEQAAAFQAAVAFSPHKSLDIVIPAAGLNGNSILNWLKKPYGEEAESESKSESVAKRKLVAPDTRVIDINFTGAWYSTHLALHFFQETLSTTSPAKTKHLLLIGSLASYTELPLATDYAAAKFGIRGVMRSLRNSVDRIFPLPASDTGAATKDGSLNQDSTAKFRINMLAPTFVRTPMTVHIEEHLKRVGIIMVEVSDTVDVAMRLICDDSIRGRAAAVAPSGQHFDIGDDWDGFDGGEILREHRIKNTFGGGGTSGVGKTMVGRQAPTISEKN
jgi:5'-hydroxyaverantin dehydrogenase